MISMSYENEIVRFGIFYEFISTDILINPVVFFLFIMPALVEVKRLSVVPDNKINHIFSENIFA